MSLETIVLASPAPRPSPLYLVEEISHRVVNEYSVAIGDLSLAAKRAPDAQARSALVRAAERLRAHAAAHRALLAPLDGTQIDLADYLGRICASISTSLLADRDIHLLLEMDEVWLDAGRCWRIGLIIAELVRNAARHGLAGRAGCIRVAVTRTATGIRCLVIDNGAGSKLEHRRGRGSRLIETLADDLSGTATWRFTTAGCRVEIEAPIVG